MTTTIPPTTTVAARAVDASKIYGKGDTEVRALDDVDVEFERSAVHRDHGPVGLGQVDAAALPRRPRPPHVGPGVPRRRRPQRAQREAAHAGPPRPIGFVFQAFNLIPTLDRAREHHAADVARRPQARPGVARPRSSTPSACATGSSTGRPSSPAASSSASRSRARSRAGPRSSSPTSRPATSTRGRAPRSSASCARRSTSSARRS